MQHVRQFTGCGFRASSVDCCAPFVVAAGNDSCALFDVRSAERQQRPFATCPSIAAGTLSAVFLSAPAAPDTMRSSTLCPSVALLASGRSGAALYRFDASAPASPLTQLLPMTSPSPSPSKLAPLGSPCAPLRRNGHSLLIGGSDGALLYDASAGVVLRTLRLPTGSPWRRCWSFAGQRCVVAVGGYAHLFTCHSD